jgi:hypothetical protein
MLACVSNDLQVKIRKGGIGNKKINQHISISVDTKGDDTGCCIVGIAIGQLQHRRTLAYL